MSTEQTTEETVDMTKPVIRATCTQMPSPRELANSYKSLPEHLQTVLVWFHVIAPDGVSIPIAGSVYRMEYLTEDAKQQRIFVQIHEAYTDAHPWLRQLHCFAITFDSATHEPTSSMVMPMSRDLLSQSQDTNTSSSTS